MVYILWPVSGETSVQDVPDIDRIKEKLEEKLIHLRDAGKEEMETTFK